MSFFKNKIIVLSILFLVNGLSATDIEADTKKEADMKDTETSILELLPWKIEEVQIVDEAGSSRAAKLYSASLEILEPKADSTQNTGVIAIVSFDKKIYLSWHKALGKNRFLLKIDGQITSLQLLGTVISFEPFALANEISETDLNISCRQKILEKLKIQRTREMKQASSPEKFDVQALLNRSFFTWGDVDARGVSFDVATIKAVAKTQNIVRVDIENIQYPQAASIWIDLTKKEIVKVEETKIPHFTMLNPYFSKPEDLKEIENIKRKHGEINIGGWNMRKVPIVGDDCKNKTAVVFDAFVTSQKSGGEELLNAFHGRTPIPFRSNIPDMYVQIAIDERGKHILWQGIYRRQIFAIINHEGKHRALGLSSRYTTPEGIVELSLVSGSPVDTELQTEKIVPSHAKLTLIALRNLVFQNSSKGSPDTYEEQLLSMSPESKESFARLIKLLNSKKLVYSAQLQLDELILTENGKHHMDFEIIDPNLNRKTVKKLEMESFVLDLKNKTISKPTKSN